MLRQIGCESKSLSEPKNWNQKDPVVSLTDGRLPRTDALLTSRTPMRSVATVGSSD